VSYFRSCVKRIMAIWLVTVFVFAACASAENLPVQNEATMGAAKPVGRAGAGMGAVTAGGEKLMAAFEPIELEPLSITGERIYDPIADPTVVPENNKIFTETIERKNIELRAPYKTTELFSFISPSIVRYDQNRKYKTFFDARGQKVSLVLDGFVVQDGSSNSGMRGDDRLLEFLNTDIIESIDVIKDSSALIYGTLKGGMLNIKTRKPTGRHGQLKFEAGTFGERVAKLTFMDILSKKSSYFISFNDRYYDGPDGKNAADSDRGGFLKYFYDPTAKDSFVLTYDREVGTYQIPVDEPDASGQFPKLMNLKAGTNTYNIVVDPRYGWSYGPWSNTFTDLNYTKTWNKNNSTNIQFSRLEVQNDFHNPRGVGANPVGHIDGHHVLETTNALALRHTFKTVKDIIVRFGYTFDHWYNPTGKLYWENKDNEDKKHSAYLQTEIPLAGEKLKLDAGVRQDRRFIIREEKARFPAGKTPFVINNRWEDPRNTYGTGLTYRPTKNDTVALRYADVVVTPVDRYASLTGAALLDEHDKMTNLGFEHQFSNARKPTSLVLNVFKNSMVNSLIDDPAGTKYTDPPNNTTAMRIFANQDTVARGGELTLKTRLSKRFDASVGCSSISYSPDIVTKPHKTYNFDLIYNGESDLAIDLYGRYVGPFVANNVSYNYTDPVTKKKVTVTAPVYNLGKFWDVGFSVTKKLDGKRKDSDRIVFSVKNLFDKRYETFAETPNYGRTFGLGYEINW